MKISRKKTKRFGAIIAVVLAAFAIAAAAVAQKSASPYSKLGIFAKVLYNLENHYVEPIDEEQMIYGAIRGMMRTVDPHSKFLTPKELALLEEDTKGKFGGIGVEVEVKDGVLTVVTPMADSPAERAGIEPGDKIIAIDKALTDEMSIDEVIEKMRGEPGASVSLMIERKGTKKIMEFTLVREVIHVKSVNAEVLAPGFIWLKVRSFQDGTTEEAANAIDDIIEKDSGLKGIALDLRRNPGGILNEAVNLADLFISDGILVTTRGRDGVIIDEYKATSRGTIEGVPMVCLIDGGSASASEIVAGALQDQGRALLVGMRSFGKGSVQGIIDLGEGYGLRLTIARYYTPSGRSIQAQGVEPDVTIESLKAPEPDEETAALNALLGEKGLIGHLTDPISADSFDDSKKIEDYQLRIAFQLLRGLANQQGKSKTN